MQTCALSRVVVLRACLGSRCTAITRGVLISWRVFSLLMPLFETRTRETGQLSHRVRNTLQCSDQAVHRVLFVVVSEGYLDGRCILILPKHHAHGVVIISQAAKAPRYPVQR